MIKIDIEKRLGKKIFHYNFKSDKKKVVIFGPSGAGKSNLLKMIAGFFSPDRGEIICNDKTFFSSDEKVNIAISKRNVGYLPQEYTLFPHMTVKDNILYGVNVKKMSFDEELFNYLVEKLEIRKLLKVYPESLSGGEKQRVAIARALIIKPELLLFDEPFSSLDKPIKDGLINIINELLEFLQIPAVFITHEIDDAYLLGEDVVVINDGRVVEFGDKNKIFSFPKYKETALLLNFKNIWEVDGYGKENYLVNDQLIEVFEVKQNVKFIGIKPENIMIVRRDNRLSKENELMVKIKRIIQLGGFYTIIVFHEKLGDIFIKLPEHAFYKLNLRNDETIKISLKKESLVELV